MKSIYSKLNSLLISLLTSIFVCSCGTDEPQSPSDTNLTGIDESLNQLGEVLPALAEDDSEMSDGLESFLNEGETFFPLPAVGAEGFAESSDGVGRGRIPPLGFKFGKRGHGDT